MRPVCVFTQNMFVQYQVICRVGLEVKKKEAGNSSSKVSGSKLRLPTVP